MAKRHKKSHSKCVISSGKKKGKLKKGFRWAKGGRGCVQAKGSRKRRKSHKKGR